MNTTALIQASRQAEALEAATTIAVMNTTIHRLEIAADRMEADPGYLPTLNPVTRLQATTALLICTTELEKPRPCLDAAYDYADRALSLIGLMRIQDAAAQRAAGKGLS